MAETAVHDSGGAGARPRRCCWLSCAARLARDQSSVASAAGARRALRRARKRPARPRTRPPRKSPPEAVPPPPAKRVAPAPRPRPQPCGAGGARADAAPHRRQRSRRGRRRCTDERDPGVRRARRAAGASGGSMSARALYRPLPEVPERLRHRDVELLAVARFQVAADGSAAGGADRAHERADPQSELARDAAHLAVLSGAGGRATRGVDDRDPHPDLGEVMQAKESYTIR